MLGKGILKRTVWGNSLLVSLIKPKKEPVFIPSVKDVISILGKPAKERTKDNIFTVSKFFESKKFFAGYVSEGNYDVIDQWSKEMNLEVAEKDKMIIKFGEFGYTFYVVVTGSVGIYIPTKETFSFTYKEYIEFLIPRIRFIASVNGDTNVKLPEFTQIVEKNDEGKINLDHLDDLLSISARNPKYSRDSIMRQMFSKNKNDYEISYFVKVAVLGDGFEFGGDALVNGKPRNATVVAEKTTFLATLQKDQYDEILKKQEQRRIERFIHRLSYFQIANHFSRTYKGKLRKYFFNVEFKRGQILYQEEDKPEDIYFLLEGEIELYKTFNVLKTDEKDTVFYKELQVIKHN